MLSDVLIRVRSLLRRSRVEEELHEELRFHLEYQARKYVEAGMNPEEAQRRARTSLGGLDRTLEECREARGLRLWDELCQDLRYAWRSLKRSPGFTVVIVIVLALGIGFNSAMFSVLDAVLLRPLPYREPERLIRIFELHGDKGERSTASPGNLRDWQRQQRSFTGLAAWGCAGFTLGIDPPEYVRGHCVSPEFFSVLGVRPQLGRSFSADEGRAGRNHVVMMSHELWLRRFGGDPELLGTDILINSERYTVVGILPRGFEAPDQFGSRERIELFTPLAFTDEDLADRGSHNWSVVGRLRPGISMAQAQADMDAIARTYVKMDQGGALVVPLKEEVVRDVRTSLLLLFGAVTLILLLACANIANLLLARAVGQQREVAVRMALGAGRFRIVRELLTHNLALAVLGGCCGLLLAQGCVSILRHLGPQNLPRLAEVSIDVRVLAFTLAISLGTGLLFGLFPALQVSGAHPHDALKGRGGPIRTIHVMRWRSMLMVAEVALSFLLLVAAGLLIKSFVLLRGVELGFQPDRVLAMQLAVPGVRYPDQQSRVAFFERIAARIATLPGVDSVAFASHLPLRGGWGGNFTLEHPPDPSQPDHQGDFQMVSPGYFRTLGVRLLRGRAFSDSDRAGAVPVAIVNETMARRLWPDGDAVGARLKKGGPTSNAPWLTIVGVVGEVRLQGQATEPAPEVYFATGQSEGLGISPADVAVRTVGDPLSLVPAIQQAVRELDPAQAVTRVRTMGDLVSASVAERRFQTLLFLLFASLAVVLAFVGVYGVVAYAVTQRTAEMGVRIALGAQRSALIRLVMGHALIFVGTGIALGAIGAYLTTQFMTTLLFGITPHDPRTFLSVAALLAAAAAAASYVPARQVTRVDPLTALRSE
ncbi:MAG: FtsX-like permease family protein [Luteitalea sp.]|nr:FtsX-like permease family protein [Luteitalea sp.]